MATDHSAQTYDDSGVDLTAVAMDATIDRFVNTGSELIMIINGSGAERTVTITTPQTVKGLAVADKVVTIATGKTAIIGPFPVRLYNVQSGANAGKVELAVDAEASMTMNVLKAA